MISIILHIRSKEEFESKEFQKIVGIVQCRKFLFIQEALLLASFTEEKHFLKKKKPSSDRVDLIILNYHASTKTYNIKITRSRRERKYVPPIVSFDHSSIYQQEKYNVTIIIKSRRK